MRTFRRDSAVNFQKPTFAEMQKIGTLGSVLSCGNAAQTSILARSECRLPFLLSDPIARAAKVRNPPLLLFSASPNVRFMSPEQLLNDVSVSGPTDRARPASK